MEMASPVVERAELGDTSVDVSLWHAREDFTCQGPVELFGLGAYSRR